MVTLECWAVISRRPQAVNHHFVKAAKLSDLYIAYAEQTPLEII